MSEKMREALLRAVAMVESDVIQVRPSERDDLMQWLTQANAALAEQPARSAHSTFANSENSVETHTASKQPAQAEAVAWVNVVDLGGGMTRLDWKDGNWWHRLAAGTHTLYTAPPAPSVPDEIKYEGDTDWNDDFDQGYREGWNACRAAMLAAAPEVVAKGVEL